LAAAWGKLTSRPDFDHWGQRMSDFFWEVHVKHHDGLFDPGHITLMQPLIGISEADLRDLHARSRDQATVKQWLAAPDSEPAVVGRSGYLISTLIRGKFHEFLAKHARAHLVQHPMRQYVSGRTSHVGEIVTLVSEELFVKMIIGRALAERSSDVRVSQWCESIDAARRALPDISFRRHNSYASAESAAAQACKSIGLFPGPSYQPNLLDWTLGLGVPIWLNLTLGFWPATLAGLAWGGYKVARGRGIGQDVAALLRREGDFTRLGRTVPGRIDRILVRGPNKSEAS